MMPEAVIVDEDGHTLCADCASRGDDAGLAIIDVESPAYCYWCGCPIGPDS